MASTLHAPSLGRRIAATKRVRPGWQRQEERARAALSDALAHDPESFGYPPRKERTGWTLPLLVDCLERHFGIRMTRQAVRRQLAWMGYSWQHRRFTREPALPERWS
jgi:transposase